MGGSNMEQITRPQFAALMAGLKSNYPNWDLNLNDGTIVLFWYEQLKDIPAEVLSLGVRKLIAQEEFYPNISKIRKACVSVSATPTTDNTEAWGMVKRAVRLYGYMRGEEALASLPIDVAQGVKHFGGWSIICASENEEADRAHFYKVMQNIKTTRNSNDVLALQMKEELKHHRELASRNEYEHLALESKHQDEKLKMMVGSTQTQIEPQGHNLESIKEILMKSIQAKAV